MWEVSLCGIAQRTFVASQEVLLGSSCLRNGSTWEFNNLLKGHTDRKEPESLLPCVSIWHFAFFLTLDRVMPILR